ncbi:MAG: ImmA/IrrE family metallo-endopeptidase [Bacteroidota bacterium]
MNTTLKGDIFEKKVFDLIENLLNNEEYYLSGKNSKIFAKKPYYSKTRESNIIFDIAIESYMPGATEYSMLNIIECKNLNKNVTVDDIEEFDSKLEQIGKHNIKGTLVSSFGFASGTKKSAKNLKIALLKVKSNNDLEWINYRKDKTKIAIDIEKENTEPFLCLVNNKIVTNIANFLLEKKIIDFYSHKDKYLDVPFVTEERIEYIIERLYNYDIHDNYCVNVNKICEFISSRYPVSFDLKTPLTGLLGKIEFSPLKISVSPDLEEKRFRFTLCHEIGHLILHYKLLQNKIDVREDNDTSVSLEFNVSEANTKRLEMQANIFANRLLLPINVFKREVKKYFEEQNIAKPRLYLDHQSTNFELVFTLIDRLSIKFNVSKQVVKMRLVQLGLLEDKTDFSIQKVLKNMQLK